MIITRHIYRELSSKLIWILGLLILVLTSNRFVGFLADAAEGAIPGDLVFLMLAYKMLATLPNIFPVAILVAILLSFIRMANDRELLVMLASGISRRFQLETVFRFTMIFSVFVAIFTLFISPWAEREMEQLKEVARQRADIAGIRPGQFKEFNKGERIVYVQNPSADKLAMEDVFLYIKQDAKKKKQTKQSVLTAESARFRNDRASGNRYVEFDSGRRYVFEDNKRNYQITEFGIYALLTDQTSAQNTGLKTEALSTGELLKSDSPAHQAELQWRISLIISCLLLPILSVLLVQIHTREEKHYVPFIIAISIYLIYSNLLSIAQTLIRKDSVPSFIGVWWIHLFLIGVLWGLHYISSIKPRPDMPQEKLTGDEA